MREREGEVRNFPGRNRGKNNQIPTTSNGFHLDIGASSENFAKKNDFWYFFRPIFFQREKTSTSRGNWRGTSLRLLQFCFLRCGTITDPRESQYKLLVHSLHANGYFAKTCPTNMGGMQLRGRGSRRDRHAKICPITVSQYTYRPDPGKKSWPIGGEKPWQICRPFTQNVRERTISPWLGLILSISSVLSILDDLRSSTSIYKSCEIV